MRINYNKPVWVYRNLRHGRNANRLYSIMQNGRVLRRTNHILLTECKFVVRESGRQRVLSERRKNVHAFVVGHIAVKGAMGIDKTGPDLPIRVTYNPYNDESFMALDGKQWPFRVNGARAVLLNERGMTACYLD